MLMFELFVDGKVIKLIHILQKPKIVMEFDCWTLIFISRIHVLAKIQKLVVDLMHIYESTFILLGTELWLFEWCHKNSFPKILECIFRMRYIIQDWIVLFLRLVLYLSNLIVKVLPNDVRSFLFLSNFNSLLTLNDWELLFFHCCFLFNENCNLFCLRVDHLSENFDTILSDCPIFRIVL